MYVICDYPYKHYIFKKFEVAKNIHFTTNLPRLNEPWYNAKNETDTKIKGVLFLTVKSLVSKYKSQHIYADMKLINWKLFYSSCYMVSTKWETVSLAFCESIKPPLTLILPNCLALRNKTSGTDVSGICWEKVAVKFSLPVLLITINFFLTAKHWFSKSSRCWK